MSKEKGLYKKYHVERIDSKPVNDCIVLEFKDPIARKAIKHWAFLMRTEGYKELYRDVMDKLIMTGGE